MIGYYIDGMRNANVATLEKAFHEQAILCGYLGDELIDRQQAVGY